VSSLAKVGRKKGDSRKTKDREKTDRANGGSRGEVQIFEKWGEITINLVG